MQMVAFRTPVAGGALPTAPTTLTATPASTSQINLSWTASTSAIGIANYAVQRCQGAGCTNFAQVATTALRNVYSDTGLLSNTSYSYRVQAIDTTGTSSTFSNTATATTQTPQPPTAPSNLTVTAASASQINLSWTASTSNVGLANYIVQRCPGAGCTNFAQVATPVGTSYSDTGLLSNTSYSYRVQAIDTAGNLSPFSTLASVTTLSASTLSITPGVSVLTFTGTQQFTASSAGVTWSVDGVVGGSASSGTITSTGLYTPPNATSTHTVNGTASGQSAGATVYVSNYPGTFTRHNDNGRTGQNTTETVLTPSNVTQAQFGKLFALPVDGYSYASPLYVANVSIPGTGFHNVVYVATEHDSVYAFDADGLSSSPLWKVSFLQAGATTVPCADVGDCGDIPIEVGITGTPVIDSGSGTLYVVAKTKESSSYVQRLHALDIATGAEKFGGPVVIQASVAGTADGTTTVNFNALRENQRPGLLLSNGIVYVGFASHADVAPYYGWVLAYNATTLQQVMAFNSTPDTHQGGIWQSGGGLSTDATGNIYFAVGNGTFDANTGGRDYGDTIAKLSPSGSVLDYFTPYNQAYMSSTNIELGSGGPVLLVDQTSGPNPHLLITAGKDGTIYVVNRDNMGRYNPNNNNQIVQYLVNALLNSTAETGNYSSPVFFNGYVYFAAVNDRLKAFQLTNGMLSVSPASQSAVTYPYRGGTFAISANGTSNGILWAMQDNSFGAPDNGVLRAYDAVNLTRELYNTSQAGTRDGLDVANKFSVPLVANGKVFVVSHTQLIAYGLLP
jgi:chitodextrinase